VEAGAQGEHKFLRGYVARPMWSAHELFHPGGQAAIGRFLDDERPHVAALIDGYNRQSPLKDVRAAAGGDA
jgi:predicted N-acyltransferase